MIKQYMVKTTSIYLQLYNNLHGVYVETKF